MADADAVWKLLITLALATVAAGLVYAAADDRGRPVRAVEALGMRDAVVVESSVLAALHGCGGDDAVAHRVRATNARGEPVDALGRTVDGRLVVGGVYRFAETHGLPLDALLEGLRQRGALPCWVTFYREARRGGMAHERILAKLDPALADVYGARFRDAVIGSLRALERAGVLEDGAGV